MKPAQLKALHVSVAAVFAAYTSFNKAEESDYSAMAKLLKAAPLNDAECVKALRDDFLATFGEAHKDAAQKRINIINNARRVAFGGTKDGKAIRGKGMPAMLEVVASVKSIRELRIALADAVPEALKSERGGDRTKGKGKGKGKGNANPVSIPKVANREDAFAAAAKILGFVQKYLKPSDGELVPAVAKCLELLPK